MTPPAHPRHTAGPTDNDTPKTLLASGLPLEHLKISECLITSKDCLVTTVLGSCVAVTFFSEKPRLAGIFHAMLPDSAGYTHRQGGAVPPLSPGEACKYVDSAIDRIASKFRVMGVKADSIEVKLFGGSLSLASDTKEVVREIVDVGAMNVAMARRSLERLGLAPTAESVMGGRGRKLFFHTATGRIWMKYLGKIGVARELSLRC